MPKKTDITAEEVQAAEAKKATFAGFYFCEGKRKTIVKAESESQALQMYKAFFGYDAKSCCESSLSPFGRDVIRSSGDMLVMSTWTER